MEGVTGEARITLPFARRKYQRDPQIDGSHLINAGRTVSPALSPAGSVARRPELGIIRTGWTKKIKIAALREPQCKN